VERIWWAVEFLPNKERKAEGLQDAKGLALLYQATVPFARQGRSPQQPDIQPIRNLVVKSPTSRKFDPKKAPESF